MMEEKHARVFKDKGGRREEDRGAKRKRAVFLESRWPVRVEQQHCGSRGYSLRE